MTVQFIPRAQSFSGAPAAGSGAVVQYTYTVPVGLRAVLVHAFVQGANNAAAANTIFANIQVTIGGTVVSVLRLNISGSANFIFAQYQPMIDLRAGDTVQGFTVNIGAVNPTMVIMSVVREYQ